MPIPIQRWARLAAWGSFWCAIPSAVWRLLTIQDLLPGTSAFQAAHAGDHGYVWTLSVAQVLIAVLTIGLVQPWGERFAGVPVPRWFPVVVGTVGGLALFAVSYLPTVLWGPLELVAVAGYAKRRYGSQASAAGRVAVHA